mmetsp:Transcript_78941/g.189505  ORF Transcript_78941/g.189505 Transcript_78941/m.189505 type:complete len:239 (-) Transcript_78941:148-864(-)
MYGPPAFCRCPTGRGQRFEQVGGPRHRRQRRVPMRARLRGGRVSGRGLGRVHLDGRPGLLQLLAELRAREGACERLDCRNVFVDWLVLLGGPRHSRAHGVSEHQDVQLLRHRVQVCGHAAARQALLAGLCGSPERGAGLFRPLDVRRSRFGQRDGPEEDRERYTWEAVGPEHLRQEEAAQQRPSGLIDSEQSANCARHWSREGGAAAWAAPRICEREGQRTAPALGPVPGSFASVRPA